MADKAYIIIIFSMLKIVASQYECYENEIFTTIIDPCNLCEIRSSCPQYSGPICDCLPGYFRNSAGQCGPPEECDRPPYNEPNRPNVIQCSIPLCRDGCFIDYSTRPCPSCKCDQRIQCSIPLCRHGCSIDYSTKPCPSCKCDQRFCGPNEVYTDCINACNDCSSINVTCEFLVCNKGCDCKKGFTRNSRKNCIPESQCPPNNNNVCPQIRCKEGYYLDNNAKPCPRCACDNKNNGSKTPVYTGSQGGIGPRSHRYGNYPSYPPAYPPAIPPPAPGPLPPLPLPNPLPPLPLPQPLPPLPLPQPLPGISPGNSPGAYSSGIPLPSLPPAKPAPPPPSTGCPNRNKCNKHCRSTGHTTGFCVGGGFMNCNCM